MAVGTFRKVSRPLETKLKVRLGLSRNQTSFSHKRGTKMRFTRHQLRQATAKAHKKAGRIKKSTILLTFILGYLVGLGTLQIIDLATAS